jgi:hypothetical protein
VEFRVDQRFDGSVDEVLAMYTDPGFYETLVGLPKVSTPEVLDRDDRGDTIILRIRYTFTADLPSAARAVLDPSKLTWVEQSTFALAARRSTSTLLADHYADRLAASAAATYEPVDGDVHSVRRVHGQLDVRMPFVGGQVEKAIVSGLKEHLADEAEVGARWLDPP